MSDRQSILSTPSPLIDDELSNMLFNNAFDIESINFESTSDLSASTMDYSSMIRSDYRPHTLGVHNVARLSILPIYPHFTLSSTGRLIKQSSNTPQLLLSNVPIQSLSEKQYNHIRCRTFPNLFNLKINPEYNNNNNNSFMIDFYQNLYMKIQQRLQVDIPILDFNLVRLQYCIDKVITQRNLQENMLNREELSVTLEFYLQIDVDMFFLKTCSFNGVQPRLINNNNNHTFEGLFCHDIPKPRFALKPCNKPHCLCCHTPCPRRYATNPKQRLIIPFSIPHIHQFVNQYRAILNCPATCETSNCIYVLTCPCGQFDFIGISKLPFSTTLALHREESNRIIREFLIGESNIDHITHGLKSDQKKANDKLWLYQHSPRCSVALQLFLDYNPDYWCFVPMKNLDIQMDNYSVSLHSSTTASSRFLFSFPSILKSSTAWNRSNEQVHSLVQNIPKPPLDFDFSPRQRQQQIHFFKLLQDRIVPLNNVDVYNANIITVLPDKCSQLFQYLIESLLITHAECKLNHIGHLIYENIYENSDPNRTLNNSWCANLIRRRSLP